MENVQLLVRSLFVLLPVLVVLPATGAAQATPGGDATFDVKEERPVTEGGTAGNNMSLSERTAPFGRVYVADESYRQLADSNRELRDRLIQAEAEIEEARTRMEELRVMLAKRDENIITIRQKPGTGVVDMADVGTPGAPGDAPYKVIDGHIDENTLSGWKTFRGIGACTTCHGPAGQGGVGKDLLASVRQNDEAFFDKIVTDGKKGTQMIPYKNNKAVIDNLHNIYAYLKARADGVLGTENLIRFPLGKKE